MVNLEALAQPMNAVSMQIPPGDAGTEATIAQMRRLIDEGSKDPVVHELAAQIITSRRVRAFDWAGEARALYEWVRRNVRFTRDIRGKETLHAAREVLRLGIGDCDDFTILICSLLSSVGQKCRIITISSDPRAPEIFSHVYPEVALGGRWVAMDAARRDPAFAKTPARFIRKRAWDLDSADYSDISGLGIMPAAMPRARVQPGAQSIPPVPNRYYHRRFRRLHGLGIDWGDVTGAIEAGTTGAARIIAASRASPYNIIPAQNFPGQPAAYQPGYPSTIQAPGFFSSISPTTLLIGGLVLVVALGRGGR